MVNMPDLTRLASVSINNSRTGEFDRDRTGQVDVTVRETSTMRCDNHDCTLEHTTYESLCTYVVQASETVYRQLAAHFTILANQEV
jgi:hypothetical protein